MKKIRLFFTTNQSVIILFLLSVVFLLQEDTISSGFGILYLILILFGYSKLKENKFISIIYLLFLVGFILLAQEVFIAGAIIVGASIIVLALMDKNKISRMYNSRCR